MKCFIPWPKKNSGNLPCSWKHLCSCCNIFVVYLRKCYSILRSLEGMETSPPHLKGCWWRKVGGVACVVSWCQAHHQHSLRPPPPLRPRPLQPTLTEPHHPLRLFSSTNVLCLGGPLRPKFDLSFHCNDQWSPSCWSCDLLFFSCHKVQNCLWGHAVCNMQEEFWRSLWLCKGQATITIKGWLEFYGIITSYVEHVYNYRLILGTYNLF